MGKVRFSILEKPPDRILREDMKFKGIAPLRLTIRPLGGKVGGASGAAVLCGGARGVADARARILAALFGGDGRRRIRRRRTG